MPNTCYRLPVLFLPSWYIVCMGWEGLGRGLGSKVMARNHLNDSRLSNDLLKVNVGLSSTYLSAFKNSFIERINKEINFKTNK